VSNAVEKGGVLVTRKKKKRSRSGRCFQGSVKRGKLLEAGMKRGTRDIFTTREKNQLLKNRSGYRWSKNPGCEKRGNPGRYAPEKRE